MRPWTVQGRTHSSHVESMYQSYLRSLKAPPPHTTYEDHETSPHFLDCSCSMVVHYSILPCRSIYRFNTATSLGNTRLGPFFVDLDPRTLKNIPMEINRRHVLIPNATFQFRVAGLGLIYNSLNRCMLTSWLFSYPSMCIYFAHPYRNIRWVYPGSLVKFKNMSCDKPPVKTTWGSLVPVQDLPYTVTYLTMASRPPLCIFPNLNRYFWALEIGIMHVVYNETEHLIWTFFNMMNRDLWDL